jgi:hypothetical protein
MDKCPPQGRSVIQLLHSTPVYEAHSITRGMMKRHSHKFASRQNNILIPIRMRVHDGCKASLGAASWAYGRNLQRSKNNNRAETAR